MALVQTFNVDASGNEVVSGTVTANAGTGTFAVSAASLPLPSGAATAAKQPALGTSGTASADVISIQGVSGMTPIQVSASTSATGTITSVAASATSVTVLASNASRKGFTLYNDSVAICKVAFAATASATSFTVSLQPNAYFENSVLYTGIITGIWASAAGSMRVTELT